MARFELIMPKMGESITEATVLKWLKNPGDKIGEDESVLEIATDKVDSDVPSPVSGIMGEALYKEGDVVQVGEAVAYIETEGGTVTESVSETPVKEETIEAPVSTPSPVINQHIETTVASSNGARFYSPLVLNIARQENIAMAELETVPGTGKEGRVTKKDILSYVKNRGDGSSVAQVETAIPAITKSTAAPSSPALASTSSDGNIEIIEMDRMRKMIAHHMVDSVQTSAHVTSFVEADVTKIVNWRNKHKGEFLKREGEKLTFTPIFIEAVITALKEFPMVNASIVGDNIHVKKDISIGMATALPSGNLIVPVIHRASERSLVGLAKEVNRLANAARSGNLKPEEIQGGTYTVSNVGTFGNLMGTPIINQPQVAILALGAIKKKPVVVETSEGDMIGIRHMMFLSHSYDHRIVDGAMGGAFVRRVADLLESWDTDRAI